MKRKRHREPNVTIIGFKLFPLDLSFRVGDTILKNYIQWNLDKSKFKENEIFSTY